MSISALSLLPPVLFYTGAAALASLAALPLVSVAHVLGGPRAAAATAAAAAAAFVALNAAEAALPRRAIKGSRARLVVVTGCDSGFGEAVARALGARGFRVLAGCLTERGAGALRGAPGVEAFALDVTSAESVSALSARVSEARAAGGAELFCLINNAGVGSGGNVDWTPMETYRRVLDVNFLGLVAVTKALLGALQDDAAAARAAGAPPPRVVNVASIAGLIAAPGMSAYAASKFAVEAFSDSLRRESAAWGLRVTIVEPSFFATPILENVSIKLEDTPADVQARWGPAWAARSARGARKLMAAAEPLGIAAAVIEAAAVDAAPRARVRAGRAGVYLLPYVAAMPAWVSDGLVRAGTRAIEPAGVAAARAVARAKAAAP
jgi:11-cis-retinol dehydrogenase